MPSEPLRKHWIDGALPSFVVQLVLSAVGAVLLGIVLVLVPALVIAAVTKPPGSSLIDRMVDQSLFRVGADNPYFAGPILAGFILGVLSHRWFRSSSAPVGLASSCHDSRFQCGDLEIPHCSLQFFGCLGQLFHFRLRCF